MLLKEISTFEKSGYYILQDGYTKTFIRCGSYKDRPYQSDNLHLDLLVDGENILRDNGSYKYNTDKKFLDYFNGSEGHNTLSIEGLDQMEKGGRFIWYYWIENAKAFLKKEKDNVIFCGKIKAYKHLGKNIYHQREITKTIGENEWLVTDSIKGVIDKKSYQYWHFSETIKNNLSITCLDANDKEI